MTTALTSFALGACADENAPAPDSAPPGMKLVWSDEFNYQGAPDPEKWGFENGFARNEEDQWYQPDNARVENGMLIIEARRERKANPTFKEGSNDWRTKRRWIDYTSSSLITRDKTRNNGGAWTYGRFEMRGKIDVRQGMWPAFWTVGQSGEWPAGGEIDIMEFYRGKLLANFVWGTISVGTASGTRKPRRLVLSTIRNGRQISCLGDGLGQRANHAFGRWRSLEFAKAQRNHQR